MRSRQTTQGLSGFFSDAAASTLPYPGGLGFVQQGMQEPEVREVLVDAWIPLEKRTVNTVNKAQMLFRFSLIARLFNLGDLFSSNEHGVV